MQNWKEFKKELLANPEVKSLYDALEPQQQVTRRLIELRLNNGLTQKQLAEKLGTKQSEIARIESGNRNLTINTLQKIALATGTKLQITFSA